MRAHSRFQRPTPTDTKLDRRHLSELTARIVFGGLTALLPPAKGAAANALVNLSVRGSISAGDNALHTSFTIEGTAPKSVLVRGLGPALAMFGVSGVLVDPVVTVYDGAGAAVASNDDWGGAPALTSARRAEGESRLVMRAVMKSAGRIHVA